MQTQPPSALRIIPFKEAANRLNCGRSTLYRDLNERSRHYKPELPKPIRMGSRVGFIEDEINDYIRGLMRARGGAVGQ